MSVAIASLPTAASCEECQGSLWVDAGDGGVCRCGCFEAHVRNKRLATNVPRSGIPPTFENASFDTFDPQREPGSNLPAVFEACRELAKAGDRGQGLALLGSTGTGKTHLAIAFLRERMQAGASGRFVSVSGLFRRLDESFGPNPDERYSTVLNRLGGVDVLVLDEIGTRRPTDFALDVMSDLVGELYDHKRTLVLTSNYSTSEVQKRLGQRLMSRLRERCAFIELKASDYRTTRPANRPKTASGQRAAIR